MTVPNSHSGVPASPHDQFATAFTPVQTDDEQHDTERSLMVTERSPGIEPMRLRGIEPVA